ncbi:MAG: caspase family protein [Bacteroidota bacterium]
MKKRTLLFVLLVLCSCISFSQSFFEFKYHYALWDNAKNAIAAEQDEYSALLLRNPDGTGIMRIQYFEYDDNRQKTSRHIVEMNITEKYDEGDEEGILDSNTLVVIGSNVRRIIGEDDDFTPDNFIFSRNDSGFFEPDFVDTYDEKTKSYSHGKFDNARLLNEEDLTEELVLTYFTKDEDFYKDLFETTTRSLTPQEQKTKLHLLLVANTNDKKIGKTCAVDMKNSFDTYKEVAEFLEIQFVPKVISGDAFSKVNVEKAINALRPARNDIVVFYYTGHGFNDHKTAYSYPYLDLRDKSYQEYGGQYTMNMEAINQKIKLKGARLNLVISDCCNNDPSQSPNMTSDDPDTRVSSIGWDKNKCIELFLNPKRISVLATAAKKGELSAGNISEGGFFTSNFLQSLEKHIGKLRTTQKELEPTWRSITTLATAETTTRAGRKWCRMPDETVKACTQHPVSKME